METGVSFVVRQVGLMSLMILVNLLKIVNLVSMVKTAISPVGDYQRKLIHDICMH